MSGETEVALDLFMSTIEIQYGADPTTWSKVIKNTSLAADLSIGPYVGIRNESFPIYICTLPMKLAYCFANVLETKLLDTLTRFRANFNLYIFYRAT